MPSWHTEGFPALPDDVKLVQTELFPQLGDDAVELGDSFLVTNRQLLRTGEKCAALRTMKNHKSLKRGTRAINRALIQKA